MAIIYRSFDLHIDVWSEVYDIHYTLSADGDEAGFEVRFLCRGDTGRLQQRRSDSSMNSGAM